jgi:hypothetical protein
MSDDLPALLDAFYAGTDNAPEVIGAIRGAFPRLLATGEWDSLVESRVQSGAFRTVRAQIWAIFLSNGPYASSSLDARALISALERGRYGELSRSIVGDFTRLSETTGERLDGIEEDELFCWVWLFSAWLSRECDQGTIFQALYTLGIAFVRNFTLPPAFQAFVRFIEPIRSLYLPVDGSTPRLTELIMKTVPEVVRAVDPEWMITANTCMVWSISRVKSLFSQISPRASKELVFDFLVIYGPHFVVYLEAAWLLLNKAKVMTGTGSADPDNARIVDPKRFLAEAARVFRATPESLRQNVMGIFYA